MGRGDKNIARIDARLHSEGVGTMSNRDWLYVFLGILAVIVAVSCAFIAFRPRDFLAWRWSRKHAREIDNDLDELFKR